MSFCKRTNYWCLVAAAADRLFHNLGAWKSVNFLGMLCGGFWASKLVKESVGLFRPTTYSPPLCLSFAFFLIRKTELTGPGFPSRCNGRYNLAHNSFSYQRKKGGEEIGKSVKERKKKRSLGESIWKAITNSQRAPVQRMIYLKWKRIAPSPFDCWLTMQRGKKKMKKEKDPRPSKVAHFIFLQLKITFYLQPRSD